METINIDLLTVLVAAVVYMILGAFWYSPMLFGKMWGKLAGVTAAKPKWYSYVGSFVIAFIAALFLALVEAFLGATSTLDGIYVAIGIWLGFIATTHFSAVLWAKKPLSRYFIEVGYMLVGFAVMGGIIAA